MIKGLIALCIVAAAHVCVAYEIQVPVFRQQYGVGETRIVGGEPAERGQFPHQADVLLYGKHFCSGSLISKNWVLTAAHCVFGYGPWTIVLGQTDRQANESGVVTVTSKKGIWHEDYVPGTIANDVALIQLPQDVQYSEFIKPIALPPRSLKDKNLDGKTVRVSGWGRTSDTSSGGFSQILRWVDLKLINFEECKKVYGDFLTSTKYCCSGADKKSTCFGDSGGPLTIGEGAELVNLGIVSFGSAGCTEGYPVGFTATPYFVDWISNKTGIPIKD